MALNNRGVALNALGRHADALKSYDRALALQPDYVSALYNRARSLDELQRHDEALACYDKVLALEPHHAVAHNNRGVALDTLGRSEEALESFAKALALRPDYAEALSNRGTALIDLDRLDEALASYDAALALDPRLCRMPLEQKPAAASAGIARGGMGGLRVAPPADAWEPRSFAGPEWDGTAQPRRRVLLYAEQALGDTIQFARFARTVADAGNDVILEVQPPLATLMQSAARRHGRRRSGGAAARVRLPSPADERSAHAAPAGRVGDGALSCGRAEAHRALASSARRRGSSRRHCLAGNPKAPGPSRAIPLEAFVPLSRIPGVRLISLQKDDGDGDLRRLRDAMTVETLGPDFDAGADAFLDTAAVMTSLDLVISSDTSIAHLAGALGRPVWIAMRHVTDWRWMVQGEATPWYSTARVFKQSARGDWAGVFERIARDLARLAG